MNRHPQISQPHSHPGLIIVGTDTGVGKTVVTGAFTKSLQRQGIHVGVMKPIETGVREGEDVSSDTRRLQTLCRPQAPLSLLAPYRFQHALSPLAASRLARCSIKIESIVSAFHELQDHYDYLLVEGIGGVMVPLTPAQDFRDLMTQLNLSCVIVSRATLGAVNHVLLTVQALTIRNIPIAAIVLNCPNRPEEQLEGQQSIPSTVQQIKEFVDVPVFGPVLFQEKLEGNWKEEITELSKTPVFTQLVETLATHTS